MLEKLYNFSNEDKKNVEKLIDDDNIAINHMIFPKGHIINMPYNTKMNVNYLL